MLLRSKQSKDALFFVSTNECFCTMWQSRKTVNCIFSLNDMQHVETRLFYSVTAEPPFIIKTIDFVHQTEPRKGVSPEYGILPSGTHMLDA